MGIVRCHRCGKTIDSGMSFCPNCGEKNPAIEVIVRCHRCGKTIDSDMSFCPNCGEKNPAMGGRADSDAAINQPVINQNPYAVPYEPPKSTPVSSDFSYPRTAQSMQWHKFIVTAGLFIGALANLAIAIITFLGIQYGGEEERELMYLFFGPLKTIDILMGVACLGLAAFGIYTRSLMVKLRANAPKMLNVLCAAAIIVSVVYLLAVGVVMNKADIDFSDTISPDYIGQLLVSITMFFVNKSYYNKRKWMFVN